MNWAFHVVAIFVFFNSITMFLFTPDTRYNRSRPSTFLVFKAPDREGQIQRVENAGSHLRAIIKECSTVDTESSPTGLNAANHSFVHDACLWRKRDPEVKLLKTFLRPSMLVTYPTVLWAYFVYGMSLGWNVVLGATVAQLFAPQYGFDYQSQGLIFLSLFVGSLIGTWLCVSMSESVANYFTRRNGGIRERELQLPTLAIGTFCTFLGYQWQLLRTAIKHIRPVASLALGS